MCGEEFKPDHRKRNRFCGRSCAARWSRLNRSDSYIPQNGDSTRRLIILKEKFSFSECMIEGCSYNNTYDIHRLIPRKLGGKYEIGNMFAICPNHHAEITRKITTVIKVDNKTLRII